MTDLEFEPGMLNQVPTLVHQTPQDRCKEVSLPILQGRHEELTLDQEQHSELGSIVAEQALFGIWMSSDPKGS